MLASAARHIHIPSAQNRLVIPGLRAAKRIARRASGATKGFCASKVQL
jgi:hypothetical protein